MVFSPLYLGQTYILQTRDVEDYFRKSATVKHLPLSTAVGLSSRFAWILPVGWYEFTLPAPIGTDEPPQRRRMTFADGGYFESSGIPTGQNIISYLLKAGQLNPRILAGMNIAPRIIRITSSYRPVDSFYQTEPRRNSYDELTVPLSTLLMAFRARNGEAAPELPYDVPTTDVSGVQLQFGDDFVPLPLGWQLADLSRHYIDLFMGRPQDCTNYASSDQDEALWSIRKNGCLMKSIVVDLQAKPAP